MQKSLPDPHLQLVAEMWHRVQPTDTDTSKESIGSVLAQCCLCWPCTQILRTAKSSLHLLLAIYGLWSSKTLCWMKEPYSIQFRQEWPSQKISADVNELPHETGKCSGCDGLLPPNLYPLKDQRAVQIHLWGLYKAAWVTISTLWPWSVWINQGQGWYQASLQCAWNQQDPQIALQCSVRW